MAAFSRQRAPGLWTPGDIVTAAEFEGIDAIRPSLMNMTGGSSHAPLTQCVIGGAGLSVTGPSSLGDLTSCVVQSGGAITCQSGSTFTCNAGCTVSLAGTTAFPFGATVNVAGAIEVNATGHIDLNSGTEVNVESGATIEVKSGAAVNVKSGAGLVVDSGGVLDLDGALLQDAGAVGTLAGANTFTGDVILNNNSAAFSSVRTLSFASSTVGSVAYRVGTVGDANATIDVSKDEYRVPRTLTGARTYTLRHSTSPTPANGQRILVSRTACISNLCNFVREGGVPLAEFPVSGNTAWVEFTYHASYGWYVSRFGGSATTSDPGGTY